jgi:hypothetical protein
MLGRPDAPPVGALADVGADLAAPLKNIGPRISPRPDPIGTTSARAFNLYIVSR